MFLYKSSLKINVTTNLFNYLAHTIINNTIVCILFVGLSLHSIAQCTVSRVYMYICNNSTEKLKIEALGGNNNLTSSKVPSNQIQFNALSVSLHRSFLRSNVTPNPTILAHSWHTHNSKRWEIRRTATHDLDSSNNCYCTTNAITAAVNYSNVSSYCN